MKFAVVLMCALIASVAALDHTHVNNLSSKDICGTTSYFVDLPPLVGSGHSQFVNRLVKAHNSGEPV